MKNSKVILKAMKHLLMVLELTIFYINMILAQKNKTISRELNSPVHKS